MDFLEVTVRRNPELIKAAVELHQSGEVPPNTMVIDLDAIKENAKVMKTEADKYKISNYYITKQFGRNPLVAQAIVNAGFESSVAIDIDEVKTLHRYGLRIGHVGHLSQIPRADVKFVVKDVNPEVITIYSIEKAKEIAKAAHESGKKQELLVRVVGEGDFFYPNQEGGFLERDLVKAVRSINGLRGVRVVGVTSFPVLRFNLKTRREEPLPNFYTILRAAKKLEEDGVEVKQINAPADTSAKVMRLLAEMGATHGEPGHGFTGTTPWHAFDDLPELPAWVYVSEVSHKLGGRAFAYGGGLMSADACVGFWTDLYHSFRIYSLVGSDPDKILERKLTALPAGYIDYYGTIFTTPTIPVEVGDTVVYGVREQIFVSRAKVAVVSGIRKGRPRVQGIFDRNGTLLDRNDTPQSIEKVKDLMRILE